MCEYEYIHYHSYNLHRFPESIRILGKYLSYVKMCYAVFCYSGVKEQRENYFLACTGASLVTQTIKNLPAMQEIWFDSWVGKIPWRRAWQSTPLFLPGECPWTEEPGVLQSLGLQRVRHDWTTKRTYPHINLQKDTIETSFLWVINGKRQNFLPSPCLRWTMNDKKW